MVLALREDRLAAEKKPHKAKPSKKASLVRSGRNRTKGVYARQRVRTEANKAARITRMMARFPRYQVPVGWRVSLIDGRVVRDPLA